MPKHYLSAPKAETLMCSVRSCTAAVLAVYLLSLTLTKHSTTSPAETREVSAQGPLQSHHRRYGAETVALIILCPPPLYLY